MRKEIKAAQVTLTSGKLRRTFTMDRPPIPKVGDIVTIKGESAEWSVTKVKPLNPDKIFSITFPKRRAAAKENERGN